MKGNSKIIRELIKKNYQKISNENFHMRNLEKINLKIFRISYENLYEFNLRNF